MSKIRQKTRGKRPLPQVSLQLLIVMMLLFALASIALLYATRVQAIQDELALLLGGSPLGNAPTSRSSHLIFLLFTYASPLMLAAVMSLVVSFRRARQR